MAEKIMLIDGNSIVNRAFYGVPLLTNGEGRYTNGVYGFLNILFKLLDEEQPDYLAVAFDLHAPTFRHRTFDGYKGTRKGMPEELREQMPLLKEVLQAMHIPIFEQEGFEADDILGTLSALAEKNGIVPVVVSGDRDLLQLAGETLKVRIPKTKGGRTETEDYYAADVQAKYGVTPAEFIDMKALMGDASDNIPGVPGIGEKTAAKIITQYHDIETAIAHAAEIKPKKASENLAAYQEQARLSKFLATIVRDMPLEWDKETLKIGDMFNQTAYELVKRLEFKSMFSRFEGSASAPKQAEQTYRFVADREGAKEVLAALKKGEVGYAFVYENEEGQGLALYQEQLGGVWMEASMAFLMQELLEIFQPFFADSAYRKIGHDVKKDIRFLRSYGYDGFTAEFDTAIGAYILNATGSSYEYDDIAAAFLNETYPSQEEVFGKGRTKKAFAALPEAERTAYGARQAEIFFRARKVMEERLAENEQKSLFYDMEMPLIYVLADMEKYGIKVDKAALLAYQKRLGESLDGMEEEIYTLAGEKFNINSPKQLGVILFEKLGLKGGKKTKTGYSTAADVLEKLIRMEVVKKEAPINDVNNKRKAGYTITDNLSLFYYRYVFRYSSQMNVMDSDVFYDRYIRDDFEKQYVPRQFEDICRQYLIRQNRAGKLSIPFDRIGKYYYDVPQTRTNGEFDIVTEDPNGYVFYEAKFRSELLTESMIQQEIEQVRRTGMNCYRYAFISRSGFDAQADEGVELISLEKLYE